MDGRRFESEDAPVWRVEMRAEDSQNWILVRAGKMRRALDGQSNALVHGPGSPDRIWGPEIESRMREGCTGQVGGNLLQVNRSPIYSDNILQDVSNVQQNGATTKSLPVETIVWNAIQVPSAKCGNDIQEAEFNAIKLGDGAKRQKCTSIHPRAGDRGSAHSKEGGEVESKSCQPLFETGSGKPVQISASAIARAKSLLGYGAMESMTTGVCKRDLHPVSTLGVQYNSNLLNRKKQLLEKDKPGYAESSGADRFSHEAMLLRENSPIVNPDLQCHKSTCAGLKDSIGHFSTGKAPTSMFQTATGRSVSVSGVAMMRAMALLGGISDADRTDVTTVPICKNSSFAFTNTTSEEHPGCFSRGIRRKPMTTTLGEETVHKWQSVMLAKAMTNLQDCQDSEKSPQLLFDAVAGHHVSVASEALEKELKLLGNESDIKNAHKLGATRKNSISENGSCISIANGITQSVKFQTAGGRSVLVSGEAMKRAADILSGGIGPSHNLQESSLLTSKANTGWTSLRPEKGQLERCYKVDAKFDREQLMLQTATGQAVPVSNASIKQAVTLIGDEDKTVHTCNGSKQTCQASGDFCETCPNLQSAKLSKFTEQKEQSLPQRVNGLGFVTPEKNVHSATLKGSCFHDPLADLSNQKFPSLFKIPGKPLERHQDYTAFQTPKVPVDINRKLGATKSFVAFKKPRRVRFSTPCLAHSECMEERKQSSAQLSMHEVVKLHSLHSEVTGRMDLQQYFGKLPHNEGEALLLANEVRVMTADTSKDYKFCNPLSSGQSKGGVGPKELRHMLLESGANPQLASKEWVENHYRWIVWKLACIERSYPLQAAGKFLTIEKTFDELKYRYEREINCGHRSALRRITEGDASAGWMMIICISAIRDLDTEQSDQATKETKVMEWDQSLLETSSDIVTAKGNSIKVQTQNKYKIASIEITDGWYCLNAILDPPLSRQLNAGKLFVGQKLRVCRATLLGCTGPMPPLQAFQVAKLMMHINGTYRTSWEERLGFCKCLSIPLAFHCIKDNGGLVPRTIVGTIRVYPLLYYERLLNGGSITRSAKAEDLALYHYNERRAQTVEEAVLRMEKENIVSASSVEKDLDEGARLYTLLENAAEPELLMADMTAAQHAAFSAYQSKKEAARQALVEKAIQKALEHAQLDSRDVTPILKIRVRGLELRCSDKVESLDHNTKGISRHKRALKEGLITIWQPTEEQVCSIREDSIYCVSDLIPVLGKSDDTKSVDLLHLRTTRSTHWKPLRQELCERYEFVFHPRAAMQLSELGTIAFHSEFDAAVVVIHIGTPYAQGLRSRQWIFVSDGSIEKSSSDDTSQVTSLLAINVSVKKDALLPMEGYLEGCIIGYCNLIKCHQDQKNWMWVAEASESAVYSLNLCLPRFSHLKSAANSLSRWMASSKHVVDDLRERVNEVLATEYGCS